MYVYVCKREERVERRAGEGERERRREGEGEGEEREKGRERPTSHASPTGPPVRTAQHWNPKDEAREAVILLGVQELG